MTVNAGNHIELKQDGSSLTVSALVSHPNLLDNGYFLNSINQQGQTGYRGDTIDRWYSEELSVTLEANSLILERADSAIAFIQRWDAEDIKSISPDIHTFGPFISFSSTRYQMVRIIPELNGRIRLIATKLELSSVQTLAHQDAFGNWVLNDPPPDRALELVKCQRYYQIVKGSFVGASSSDLGGYQRCTVALPTTMRSVPAISVLKAFPSGVAAQIGTNPSPCAINSYASNGTYFDIREFAADANL